MASKYFLIPVPRVVRHAAYAAGKHRGLQFPLHHPGAGGGWVQLVVDVPPLVEFPALGKVFFDLLHGGWVLGKDPL